MLSTTAEPPANPHQVSVGNARYGPHSETDGKPQDLVEIWLAFIISCRLMRGFSSMSTNAAGPQGYRAGCLKRMLKLASDTQ